VQKKIMSKCELPKSIPLHGQRLNYGIGVCELEDHVGEKGWNLKWPTKLALAKKTPFINFPTHLLESN